MLSVCLGWMHCCTPLPSLSPLCTYGPQELCHCHPTRSARPPSQVDLAHSWFVVFLCPLSTPVNVNYFAVVALHILRPKRPDLFLLAVRNLLLV
jgi:hypothetical protein